MITLPYTYTDPDGNSLTISSTTVRITDVLRVFDELAVPTGEDAVDGARAFLAADGDTGHQVISSEELTRLRARVAELEKRQRGVDRLVAESVLSMRDRAAQEVLIDTHRAPMAISEAIAVLPLLVDTARPDPAPLPAEDLVEPGDEVPTLAELYELIHELKTEAASAEQLRKVEERVAELEAREHVIDLDDGTGIQVPAAPGVLKGDTDDDPTPDPVELIDAAARRLGEATKGTPAAADAAGVIAALRAVLSCHVSIPYQPSGGNDPDRCRHCGENPGDGKHPADEDGPAFGGYYRCTNQTITAVCEYCDDEPGYGIHAWPCMTASTVIRALAAATDG